MPCDDSQNPAKNMKAGKKTIIGLAVIILLFIASTYFVGHYISFIRDAIPKGPFNGTLIYFLLAIFDAVALPILIPLIPLATDLFGFFWAALLTIAGWTIGVALAYFIARRFGRNILKRYASFESIKALKKLVPEKNIFWFIVILRIFLPLDIGSYYLGLVSDVKFKKYMAASFIGIVPSAVALSYFGGLPAEYEIIGLVAGTIILGTACYIWNRRKG